MNRTVVNRGLRRAMAMVLAMVIYALPVAMPIAETTEVTAYAKSNKVLYSSAKKNISLKKEQKKTVTIVWKKKGNFPASHQIKKWLPVLYQKKAGTANSL